MPSLIIYDSQFGNTEKIAQAIGQALSSETKVVRPNETNAAELQSAELLVVGSPTQGGRPTKPIQDLINSLPANGLKNIKAGAFDTGISVEDQGWLGRTAVKFFGYASKRIAALLESKGASVIGAETFFVLGKEGPLKDGELERATQWARDIPSTQSGA